MATPSELVIRLARAERSRHAAMVRDDVRHEPLVTFAIPVHNREKALGDLLESIRKQRYSNYEIIVIDQFSSDDSAKVATRYGARVVFSAGSLGEMRQLGFALARGEIVHMSDSDTIIPHPDWLAGAIRLFSLGERISTVWCLAVACGGSILARAFSNYAWCFNLSEFLAGRFPAGGGGSFLRLDCVKQVGGIDIPMDYGEDFYLAGKLRSAGFDVVLDPDPIIHVSHTRWSEVVEKELRRSGSFRRVGLRILTGYNERTLIGRQLAVGLESTILGLVLDRDVSWVLVPVLLLVRSIAWFLSRFMARSAYHARGFH